MRRTVQRRTTIGFIALMALLIPSPPAAAAPPSADTVIVLDGATSAEGIAAGRGTTFYAGDLALGDIYQGTSAAKPPIALLMSLTLTRFREWPWA
jgi:hypothetical protein